MSPRKLDKDRYKWAFVLLPTLLTFLCFIPSLNCGWTNWDDPTYVLQNKLIVSDTIEWKAIWQKNQVLGIYHPITLLSYALDYQFWGNDAFGYHLTNVLFHTANTALVFLVFRRLGSSLLVSTTVALFFGIHPMHVESVSWISERKDVLYVFFLLLAWLSYLRYRMIDSSKKWMWYGLMLGLFTLSFLSKPIAFVFPLVLILTDFLLASQFELKRTWDKIPVLLLAAIAVASAQDGQVASDSISLASDHPVPTLFYGTYNLSLYFCKAFVPLGLSIFHPFPLDASMNWIFYASLLPFAGLLFALYWSYRKSKRLFFGLAFFILTIAPLLQIIPFGKTLTSERYTYFAYIGLFYALGVLLERCWNRPQWRRSVIPVSSVFGLVLILLTVSQQNVWKNSETLWNSVIEKYPEAYYPYVCRGRYYNEIDQPKMAMKDFNKSIALEANPDAYYERGILNEIDGNKKAALRDYLLATKGSRRYPKAHLNAGKVYASIGNRDKALYHIDKAIEQDPRYTLAMYNRAVLYKMSGNFRKALGSMNLALVYEPDNLQYVELRAAILTDLRKHKEAISDFKKVIAAQPDNARALFYTGVNYHYLNVREHALKYLQLAQQYGYTIPEAFSSEYNLQP